MVLHGKLHWHDMRPNWLTGIPDRRKGDQANLIVKGITEDLDAIDYTKYFSTVKKRGANTGSEQKQFSEFSVRAVIAVQVCLMCL